MYDTLFLAGIFFIYYALVMYPVLLLFFAAFRKKVANEKQLCFAWKNDARTISVQLMDERKKHSCCISFDIDSKKDIYCLPKVLQLLKKYDMKANFACVGRWIERYPGIHKRILDEGHEILNHTCTHPDNEFFNPNIKFNRLSREGKKREVKQCHEICKKMLDYEPRGFRVPHFGRLFTADIYKILEELGYAYSSSTVGNILSMRDEIIEIPLNRCPLHKSKVFDTYHAFRSKNFLMRHTSKSFIENFRKLLKMNIEQDRFTNIYLDPQDTDRFDFNKFLLMIKDQNIIPVTYTEIIKK